MISPEQQPEQRNMLDINPLHLPLVLKKIMSYLNFQELANYRVVSRQWYEVGTPLLLEMIDQFVLNFSVVAVNVGGELADMDDDIGHSRAHKDDVSDYDTDDESWESSESEDIILRVHPGNPKFSKIPAYLAHLDSGSPVRFTNFRLYNLKLKHSVAQQFFEKCGATIKTLDISLDTQERNITGDGVGLNSTDDEDENDQLEEDFNDEDGRFYLDHITFRKIILEQCPNLKSLELSGLPQNVTLSGFLTPAEVISPPSTLIRSLNIHHNYRTLRLSNEFLRDMFLICPQLDDATSITNYDSFRHDYRFFMRLEENRRLAQLNRLSLHQVDQRVIRTLEVFKGILRLKWFKAKSFLPSTVEREFLGFLESQSPTLEYLIIRELSTMILSPSRMAGSANPLMFPSCMPKLKMLRIGLGYRPSVKFVCVDLATQFPSLNTLILPGDYRTVNIDMILNSAKPLPSLETLELPMCLRSEIMARIGPMFPNLRHLSVGYQSDIALRHIWTNWPNLETFFLSAYPPVWCKEESARYAGLDALFSGYDINQMQMVKSKEGFMEPPTFPSISNLRKLRQVTIHCGPERISYSGSRNPKYKVGNILFSHALNKLPSLEYLDITVKHQVAPNFIDKICRRRNLIQKVSPDFSIKLERHRFGKHPVFLEDDANY